MESNLCDWWLNEVKKRKKAIPLAWVKDRARKTSNHRDQFKASKGWLDKFTKRYNMENRIQEILNNLPFSYLNLDEHYYHNYDIDNSS